MVPGHITETDTDEMSVGNAHLNEMPVKFSVWVNEGQYKVANCFVPKEIDGLLVPPGKACSLLTDHLITG